MKKPVLFMAFAFLAVFSAGSQAFPDPLIESIGYNDFDFGDTYSYNKGNSGPVIVHGWSRDGYFFYSDFALFYGRRGFVMQDLVTDEKVWNDYFSSSEITEAIERFDIEPDTGETGEIPFTLNGSEYEAFITDERKADPELDTSFYPGALIVDVFVKRNGIQKKIGSMYSNLIAGDLQFRYAKSPFENRIAVIVFVPQIHIEFDYHYYATYVFGCDLDTGF
jgi:hypothetical protein